MSGFTLIEVLVAISILAIIMTSIYGVFSTVSVAGNRLEKDSAEYHLARVAFDRLGRELHGVHYRKADRTTWLRGGRDDNERPFLELTTSAVTPSSALGTGIAEVRYRLSQDTEDGGAALYRGERARQAATPASGDAGMMRLAPGLELLTFRFRHNDRWQDQWDSDRDGLPQLVEVTLVTGRDPQRQTIFRSAFLLPEVGAR